MSLDDLLKQYISTRFSVPDTDIPKDINVDFTHICPSCKLSYDIQEFISKKSRAYIYCRKCRNNWPKLKAKLTRENPPTQNCECCEVLFTEDNPPCLDHCHDTFAFRGWLCKSCNSGISMFKNSIQKLQQAIEYLKKKGF